MGKAQEVGCFVYEQSIRRLAYSVQYHGATKETYTHS